MQISTIIEKVACTANMNRDTLIAAGIQAFLMDRKRDILLEKMKLLSRYGTATKEALEKKIENGEIVEHPAWEDLILIENLEAKLDEIDEYCADLSKAVGTGFIQVH